MLYPTWQQSISSGMQKQHKPGTVTHSHSVPEIKSNLRKRLRDELTPVPRTYNVSSPKSSLYHSRLRKRFPPLPKTREEMRLMTSSPTLLMVNGSFVRLKVLEIRSRSLLLMTTLTTSAHLIPSMFNVMAHFR